MTVSRRTLLKGFGGAVTLGVLGVPAKRVKRMNVLWIITDDQPPYMMEPMLYTRRGIRDMGINFRGAHTDIPLCGPARVSILTGLSVNTHGCDTNMTWPKFTSSPLGLKHRIVAKYLKGAGYTTGHFGKYINEHGGTGGVPPHWDKWVEVMGDNTGHPEINIDGVVRDATPEEILSIVAADECQSFIKNHAGTPWFAQYCPTIPHFPFTPSSISKGSYEGDRRKAPSVNEKNMSDKPSWMRKLKPEKGMQGTYEGQEEELRDLDRLGIKPVLETLAKTGQLDDTVIFFVSDNGYLHGEHRLSKKDKPYWESAQVPFFIRGPGVANGVTSDALVSHVDMMPTTLDIAGVPPAKVKVDGRSMLPHLKSGKFHGWRKRLLVTGSDAVGPQQNPGGSNDPSGQWWLLREGEEAFVLRESGAMELYRMESDPYQMRNLNKKVGHAQLDDLVRRVRRLRGSSGRRRRLLEE